MKFFNFYTNKVKTSYLFEIGLTLLAVFLWPFWRFKDLQLDGDYSFLWYLHEAFYKGLKYGTDILITAGPWSILNYSVFHPETYIYVLTIQVIVSILLVFALFKIINKTDINPLLKFIIFFFIISALSLSTDARSLLYLFIIPILYEVIKKKYSLFLFSYLFFSAFVALSKGSYTIIVLINILMLFFLELRSKKNNFSYSIILLLSIIIVSYLANHNIKDLTLYFTSIFKISNAYSQIFAEEGNIILYFLFLASIIYSLYKISLTENSKSKLYIINWIMTTLYSLFFLILIKTGFLRQDGEHMIRALITFPIFIFLYFSTNTNSINNKILILKHKPESLIYIVIVGILLSFLLWPSTKTMFEGKFNRVIMQWEGLKDVLLSNASSTKSKYLNAEYNFYNKEIPTQKYTLFVNFITPFINSKIKSFDVVPGVTNYMNSSNYISLKNSNYLDDSGRLNLVYQQSDLDPFSHSFLSLYQNYYYIEKISSIFFLYKRRKEKIQLNQVCSEKKIIGWGSQINLKDIQNKTKIIKIFYQRSILDQIVSIFFKPIPVSVKKYNYENNKITYRNLPLENKSATEGFLVNLSKNWQKDMPNEIVNKINSVKSISIFSGREESILNKIWNEKLFLKNKLEIQFCTLE